MRPLSPPSPPSLPYIFYHDVDAPFTVDASTVPNLHSLLRTFSPRLPSSSPASLTLSSVFASLDNPYGFQCDVVLPSAVSESEPSLLSSRSSPLCQTFFTPFLSALLLYSAPAAAAAAFPPSALLFSHTDAVPPHTRYPLPYAVHHLALHQPAFAALLLLPLSAFDCERSLLSLYWQPLLVDVTMEARLAGHFLSYHSLQVRRRRREGAGHGGQPPAEDAADEQLVEQDEREEGEEAAVEEREEGQEAEPQQDEPQHELQQEDEQGELTLVGYVACRVECETWWGAGTAAGGQRVTHVDVENELNDALTAEQLLHADYIHSVIQTKQR